MGSRGDGTSSPGDTVDITGTLTGRVDLLSGVDAMAAADREERQWPHVNKNKTKLKTHVLQRYLRVLEIFIEIHKDSSKII